MRSSSDTAQQKEDVMLWQRMLQGDRMSIEVLYRKHYDLLLNYGLKLGGDREMVRDCIQDLFVKLCKSTNLAPTEYVRSYLLRAFKNILLDKCGSEKPTEDLDAKAFSFATPDYALETLFKDDDQALQLSKRLTEAYKKLSPNQRTVIYLHYIKGLSYKEIAQIMDMNVQSSMNLVSRALTKLRTQLSAGDFKTMLIIGYAIEAYIGLR